MDFFTYLKNVFDEVKNIGKTDEKSKSAQSELSDYIKNYDAGAAESNSGKTNENAYDGMLKDDEIEALAQSEYEGKKQSESDYVSMDYDNRVAGENLKKQALKDNFDYTLSSIGQTFENALEKSKNASIKQGIARSSIETGKAQTLENAKADTIAAAAKGFDADIKKIDLAVSSLELKRRGALNDLDYEYAALIDTRIKKLKDERAKQEQEIAKAEKAAATPPATDNEKKSQDIFLKADELLGGMSAKEARDYVTNNESLKLALTPYYYYKLYKKYA